LRIVVTCNGPGETAGWLRPLLRELYSKRPDANVHVFYVPDDYATGQEPAVVRELFPQATVYDSGTYVKVALGARADGLSDGADAVLYLGGDLMHAARLHKRFGGALMSYKFSRPRYARATAKAFAVDEPNAAQLRGWGVPAQRVDIVGNLAIDGALIESSATPEPAAPSGGVLVMPGSRSYEIEHLVPLFFTSALAMRREDPSLPIAFGISPFNPLSEVRAAAEAGGTPYVFAQRGTVIEENGNAFLTTLDRRTRFPIVRNALAAAREARLIVTIPGTKVIELAAIGKPVIACTPLNAPEVITINGPLTYIDHIPFIGIPVKRRLVLSVDHRHKYHTQPNIDAQNDLVHELHGTLTPGRVARVALDRAADSAWLERTSQALAGLYREHVGAAARLAAGILTVAAPAG
jgi:hypothetical protein